MISISWMRNRELTLAAFHLDIFRLNGYFNRRGCWSCRKDFSCTPKILIGWKKR